ncbi:CapA family protein [Cohnella zeiphila]|uniref:CapA family protein n=1 Tax=Cohnella zeiphila TaxID=2761120 RepID=A0A7X0SXZ1_9BACL|nr:CapA family protein [Cohnella zeiphila]MBB6735993.1 CapA family protein [Cohnella zeiphila]
MLLSLLIAFPAGAISERFRSPASVADSMSEEAMAGTAASDSDEEPEVPVTVNLVGDMLLASTVDTNIRKYGVGYPFAKTAETLADADVTFGNLETSVSERGTPQDKQFTFRSRPESLQGLVDAGFDGVTVANNHTMDYGTAALQDTLANLDAYRLGHTGAGNNTEQAFQPFVKEVRGRKVAILGISRVLPDGSWYAGANKPGIAQGYSMEPMLSYLKKTEEASDVTIVYIHWNKERKEYPEAYAREYAKAFINAGADAVIGAHSHCLQGIEWYKGKPIFYSLGNFVFTAGSALTNTTMIAKLSFAPDGQVEAQVTPALIRNTQPSLMDAKFNAATYAKLNKISFNATIGPDGTVTEKQETSKTS